MEVEQVAPEGRSASPERPASRPGPLSGLVVVDAAPLFVGASRAEHADLLDGHVGRWIADHDLDEVAAEFERAETAVAPIYDIRDVFEDPQYRALDTITTVHDDDLGPLRMQNVLFRLSETPGSIKWTGRARGADNEDVWGGLGVSADELAALREKGVV